MACNCFFKTCSDSDVVKIPIALVTSVLSTIGCYCIS